MKEIQPLPRMDILSNFREQLCKLEGPCAECDRAGRRQDREGVIDALSVLKRSRLDSGRALRAYKVHFKAAHKWVAVAKVIGAFIQRDEKTVYRMIADYERASQLPAITIDALLDQNVDPAAGKNVLIVEELLQQPEPETQEQAAKNVARAVTKQSIAKKKKKAPAKSATTDFREFAEWMVKKLEDRYRSAPLEQKEAEVRYLFELANSTLRLEIRELRQFSRPALVPKPEQRRAVA